MKHVAPIVLACLLAGCGGTADQNAPRGYEPPPRRDRGILTVRNRTDRQVACDIHGHGLFRVEGGSFVRVDARGSMSIADMFDKPHAIDWVECGARRLDDLNFSEDTPNLTLVYTADRFSKS